MEVKDLAKETLSKGKALKFDKLFEISNSSNIFNIYLLLIPIAKFYSFTFCSSRGIRNSIRVRLRGMNS